MSLAQIKDKITTETDSDHATENGDHSSVITYDAASGYTSETIRTLSSEHRATLKNESAISDEVIKARGYWTATTKEELEDAGFTKKYQSSLFPALIIPVHDIDGEIPYSIMRPDIARKLNGKPRKYETPAGSSAKLDISPLTRQHRDDPNIPVIITEGAKKADSADSHYIDHGAFIISINGVYNFRGKNDKGGVTALPEWESIAYKGRVFYIAFDSDAENNQAVSTALRRLSLFLESKGAIVKIVVLPPGENGEKTGLDDYFARDGGTVENLYNLSRDLEALTAQKARKKAEAKAAKWEQLKESGKAIIETYDRDPDDVLTDFSNVISKHNSPSPSIFWSPRGMCEIGRDNEDNPILAPMVTARLQSVISRLATFTGTSNETALPTVTHLSKGMYETYLSDESRWNGVPPIQQIVETPFISKDAQICAKHGYHAAEKVYLSLPANYKLPDTTPTAQNIKAAKVLLIDELLGEVAFATASPANLAGALALMLLPPLMPYLSEQTPLHLFDAPTQGTGKTRAVEICLAPFTNTTPTSDKKKEEEVQKEIFTLLLEGTAAIFIDNVKGSLGSPEIATAITSPWMRGRILGKSETAKVSSHVVWAATSNNATLDADTISRSILIRLDANMESPGTRVFTGNPLETIRNDRGRVQAAILTLIRAWIEAGKPLRKEKVSRFPEWEATIGGIFECVGIEGFLQNQDERKHSENPEDSIFRNFVAAWQAEHDEYMRTVKELLEKTPDIDEMTDFLGDKRPGQQLGKMLQQTKDKVIGGYKITKATEGGRTARWRLLKI